MDNPGSSLDFVRSVEAIAPPPGTFLDYDWLVAVVGRAPRTSLEFAVVADATGRSVSQLLGVPRCRGVWDSTVGNRLRRLKGLAQRRIRFGFTAR